MTGKEWLQKNVEEFSRLQSYMKLCVQRDQRIRKGIAGLGCCADQILGADR